MRQVSVMVDKYCKSMYHLKQIHAQMLTSGRIHDAFAASRLLNFCALSPFGDPTYAFKLFQTINNINSFMWNTMIRCSNPMQALNLYVQMTRLGVIPGKHTFSFLLKACSYLKSIICCHQVHAQVFKFGFDADLHVANGLVRGYSVSGGIIGARKVFDEMVDRNTSIWTSMVCGYAQNKYAPEAIELFHGMVSEGFEPNGVVLSSVLSACARSGCLDLGEQIHLFIMEKGIDLGVILGTALVNMYVKNGALVKARQCFDGLKEKNIATWNAMICGLASHGCADEAIKVFKVVEEEGVGLNDITLVGVLSACCHSGLLDYGREIFYSMERVYGIEPKLEHYGCMVDLLGRTGRLLEAEQLIKGMAWKADVVILGALLSACKEYANIEVAERVVKEIVHLDPQNHGAYVILSNMYAEAGRWEDVKNRRKVMKEGSLKKTAGRSLVGGHT